MASTEPTKLSTPIIVSADTLRLLHAIAAQAGTVVDLVARTGLTRDRVCATTQRLALAGLLVRHRAPTDGRIYFHRTQTIVWALAPDADLSRVRARSYNDDRIPPAPPEPEPTQPQAPRPVRCVFGIEMEVAWDGRASLIGPRETKGSLYGETSR